MVAAPVVWRDRGRRRFVPFNVLYIRTNRRRGGFVENITMEKIGATATPVRVLGDKDLPVRDIVVERVAIGTARGQRSRLENVENIRLTDVSIGDFVEQPDTENRNR